MKKKILFFSCEPGGAEVLIPVIDLLQEQKQFEVKVMAYGYAVDRFLKKKIDYVEIGPVPLEDFSLLDNETPDLLITSATSLPVMDMSEKHLWRQAKQYGIPSLAFLDQWQNYWLRFSGREADEKLAYLPDWINCLNEIGREEMIQEGFDKTKLITLGHPYLSSLKHDFSIIDATPLKTKLNLSEADKVVLFISEPIREYYGNERGYDQYQVLDYFMSNIASEAKQLKILVKLHPKDDPGLYLDLAHKYETLLPQFIRNEFSPSECLAVSDFIFGMTSIMLIEAYVLGKKVMSLQPGLSVENPLVLSRYNLIPTILLREKYNLFEFNSLTRNQFDVDFADEKFLNFIDQTLN